MTTPSDTHTMCVHCSVLTLDVSCQNGYNFSFAAVFEPLGDVMIGWEDRAQMKPALFVISCGEGHLDLRTADKVMQTLVAKDSGQSGLPSPATIISEKNYIIVWEINS